MRRAVSAAADVAERDAVACELFAEAIQRFGTQQLKAGGRSMLPAIWPGDRLVIQATDPFQIAIDDVVAFRRRSAIGVHRVVATVDLPSGVHLVTRGDRLSEEDEPTAQPALLGRVISIRRGPFRLDPVRPVPFAWRAASALFEGALAGRQRLSSAWRRARAVVSCESAWASLCPIPVVRDMIPGRGIPAGGVPSPSHVPDMLGRRALPSGRRAPGLMPRSTGTGH